MPASDRPDPAATEPRQGWMAVLARASGEEIASLLGDAPALPRHALLRGPETGSVMLQGRIGGSGGAFNLGEMTVTRCTVRLADGGIGHAYVAGTDARQAELAALVDAALQSPALRERLHRAVVAPLAARQRAAREATAQRAAATRVEFFTLSTMRAG